MDPWTSSLFNYSHLYNTHILTVSTEDNTRTQRLLTLRCESNDKMDKNNRMYVAVTKLTKYQNSHTESIITTYRCVEITWGACKCKSHTPSCAGSKACLVEWKRYLRHDKCTQQTCMRTCHSHFRSFAVVFSVDRKKFRYFNSNVWRNLPKNKNKLIQTKIYLSLNL